jgi:RNA polymerase sigma-70 factor (ECF subfamily)
MGRSAGADSTSDAALGVDSKEDMVGLMKLEAEIRTLVRKAQKGDRAAFDQLFERYRSGVRSHLELRLREPARRKVDVDDLLQETFLRALQKIGSFRWQGEESFLRWLRGIGTNVVLQAAGRLARDAMLTLDPAFPAADLSQSRALRRQERFERLQEALDKLSPDHRQVILLARVERVPISEIATRMDRSPGAVSHLLMRAVQKLREAFGQTESFHLPDRSLLDNGGGA